MSTRSHIVNLSTHSSRNDPSTEYRPLPALIKNIQTISIEALEAKLVDMLNTADDRLFDMAESSYNNAQFDAMRLLRVKREGLISRFKQELSNNFKQTLCKIGDEPVDDNVETLSFENIALVKDDDLEEDIATDSMVNKARTKNSDALEHIRIRIDTIISDKSIEQQNNPLEPVYICEAFRGATQALDLDIASLLIIYKLFDRSVIDQLDSVYLLVNQFFVERGILPELKIGSYTVNKKQDSDSHRSSQQSEFGDVINNLPTDQSVDISRPANTINQQTTSSAVLDQSNVVSVIQQLLAERRIGHDVSNSSHAAGGQVEARSGNDFGPIVVETDQLVHALSKIQYQQHQAGSANTVRSLSDLRQSISVQLPDMGGDGALGQFNEDMIDIVAMLFDFILEDENLELEIKSIIGRLQIPMLKVGLVDKTFFSQKRHPARRLLNELAHAGLAWDSHDPTAKPMLQKISEIAERVIQEFEEDISLFGELLEEFIEFKTQHQQRSKIFERRTKEAEEGKAKTESARGDVNKTLKSICRGQHIPDVVKQLLKTVWSHALLLERLKDNKEGWKRRVKVAKLLVWSVQAIDCLEHLNKMKSKIPSLVKSLKQGVELISLSPIESTHLFDELERCHREIIEAAKEAIKEADLIRLPAIDVNTASSNSPATVGNGAQHETNEVEDNLAAEPEHEEIVIEDVGFTKAETGSTLSNSNLEPIKVDPENEQRIEQLRAGSWVELKIDGRFQRSKLAARIATSGKYIFVNRSGMKMAEFFTVELCQHLQRGNMNILNDDALFDRALESVISNLRDMKAQA